MQSLKLQRGAVVTRLSPARMPHELVIANKSFKNSRAQTFTCRAARKPIPVDPYMLPKITNKAQLESERECEYCMAKSLLHLFAKSSHMAPMNDHVHLDTTFAHMYTPSYSHTGNGICPCMAGIDAWQLKFGLCMESRMHRSIGDAVAGIERMLHHVPTWLCVGVLYH